MKNNAILLLIAFVFFVNSSAIAQTFKGDSYTMEQVVDPRFGIQRYEALNTRLGGDSVRKCAGYACKGWVVDYYESGAVLHEGFYIDGQLSMYKNFYATGALEREFKTIDDIKSVKTLYYLGGKVKSRISYSKKYARKWEDFFENGNPEFYEEYNKKIDYLIEQRYYHNNGKLRSQLLLISEKKLSYSKEEYYENGNLKEKGLVVYNMDALDYQKKGEWVFYDEQGKELERKTFD